MKLLLDQCMPNGFAPLLVGHEVSTAKSQGFDTLSNGRLLAAGATAGFDVLITIDGSIRYQQNLARLPLGEIIIEVVNNSMAKVAPAAPLVLDALPTMKPRTLKVLTASVA